MTPTAGPTAVAKIGSTTMPGINWKLDIDPKAKDYSNFQTGRARIKTLTDVTATVELVWDQSSQPNDPAGLDLVDGAAVTMKFYTDSTHFFSVPGVITKVSPGVAGLEDVVMYPVELGLSGTLIYPTIP